MSLEMKELKTNLQMLRLVVVGLQFLLECEWSSVLYQFILENLHSFGNKFKLLRTVLSSLLKSLSFTVYPSTYKLPVFTDLSVSVTFHSPVDMRAWIKSTVAPVIWNVKLCHNG